jgi:hypothetical protein
LSNIVTAVLLIALTSAANDPVNMRASARRMRTAPKRALRAPA